MDDNEKQTLKDDFHTLIYRKSDGEIVGTMIGTQEVPLQILIEQHVEIVTQAVTMEDADGAEVVIPVPLVVAGHGEVHRKTELDSDLDRLFITRADSKDEAYQARAKDYELTWQTLTASIDGEETDLLIQPSITEKYIVVTDDDGNPRSEIKERAAVLETDSHYSYINDRVLLVSEEDWPVDGDSDLSKFIEFKKVDHANRRLIDE